MTRAACVVLLVALAGCSGDASGPDAPVSQPTPSGDQTAPAPAALTLTVDAGTVATQADALPVNITVGRPALVQVSAGDFSFEHEAEASVVVAVALGYGRTNVTITADDGTSTARETFVAVRLAPATFEVDYGVASSKAEIQDELWLDIHAFHSAALYTQQGGDHPGFANVHDVMVFWEQDKGHTVEYGYSEGFQSFSVSRVDGEGNPLTASAPPYWCYDINGEAASLGITLEPFTPGDTIRWELGACA